MEEEIAREPQNELMPSSGGATGSLDIASFDFDLVGVGGFDCEFLERPSNIQSECPLCLLILREPYQSPCCGKSFCRVCIERVQADNKPCPTCKKENFATFHNKGLQLSLYGFQVYCSHKQEGCEWAEELGQLENLSPQPDKQLEGCEYSVVECIYCSESIKRSNIVVHQNDLCPKRPFSCEYCHSYESQYEDVIHNHWPVCGYHPVQCPNECGTFPQRQALENHVAKECPVTVVDCDFHHVGCDVRLPRKDMAAHLKETLVTHMSLQLASQTRMLLELQEKIVKLENSLNATQTLLENTQKKSSEAVQRISLLESTQKENQKSSAALSNAVQMVSEFVFMPTLPNGCVEFTMENYSHAQLKWPFRGQITIELVDQGEKGEHYSGTIEFTDGTPYEQACRIAEGLRRNETGCTSNQFISQGELETKYLKDNCLQFRVSRIAF